MLLTTTDFQCSPVQLHNAFLQQNSILRRIFTLLINIKREWGDFLNTQNLNLEKSIVTWFYLLVFNWMETDMNASLRPIVRSFSSLNNWRSLEYITRETVSLEDWVMMFIFIKMHLKIDFMRTLTSSGFFVLLTFFFLAQQHNLWFVHWWLYQSRPHVRNSDIIRGASHGVLETQVSNS